MRTLFTSTRRNAIRRDDQPLLWSIAALAGIAAAFAGCRPTGQMAVDVVLVAALGVLTTWLSGSASWWSLCAVGFFAAAFAGSLLGVLAAAAVGAVGIALGYRRHNLVWARAAAGGVAVQVLLRLQADPFFGCTALVAGTLLVLLWVVCAVRRRSAVRRRLRLGLYVAGGVVGVALVLFVGRVALVQSDLRDGYYAVLDGLEQLDGGDTVAAAATLHEAAGQLRHVADASGSVFTAPARLVPVLAQHRNALADVVDRAATAADAAAEALEAVDLDSLTIEQGAIDLDALSVLAQPLADLHAAVDSLREAIVAADSPWLLDPAADRLHRYRTRAEQAAAQAAASSTAARLGPDMLGASGRRSYLIGFMSPAEARGAIGMMSNYALLTVDNGVIRRSEFGRTNLLSNEVDEADPIAIEASDEFVARYGSYTLDSSGNAAHSVWSNTTMTPDVPTAAAVLAQVWEGTGHPPVDGVFFVDPAGLAALLRATGPVTVEGLDQPLDAASVERFLYIDQYDADWEERSEMLDRVATATLEAVLGGQLPAPQHLARELGPAATGGDLVGWARRPAEQELMGLIGMDGALPTPNGRDGLAVITNNASANKIDSFLERSTTYDAHVDDGFVRATVTIALHNDAPASGYPSYVLGSEFLDLPSGTNRTLLSVYTPLERVGATLDGEVTGMQNNNELGWHVYTIRLDLAPGQTRVVTIDLVGRVDGEYELLLRPQPLATPDTYTIELRGDVGFEYVGTISRRSVIDGGGIRALRPQPLNSEGQAT